MQKFHSVAFDPSSGQARAGASVLVNVSGGGAATLYADNEVTVLTNPLITDSAGRFEFKAIDGEYDLVVSGVGFTTFTLSKVQIMDKDNYSPVVHTHPLTVHTHADSSQGGQLVATSALTATGVKDGTTVLAGDDSWRPGPLTMALVREQTTLFY